MLHSELGKGQHGTVFEAMNKNTGEIAAVIYASFCVVNLLFLQS